MSTNPYFRQNVRSEQNLYEDLIVESIRMFGNDIYYIPREVVHRDMIFNDSILSAFKHAYKVETYIESIEGYEGDGALFQKFGVELRDAVTLVMSRRRWNTEIRQYQEQETGSVTRPNKSGETYYRPREGDLIHIPLSGTTFQIMNVEDDAPFFQLGNLPTFKLRCEKFEYSDEDFDTNIPEIDRMERFAAYQWTIGLDSSSNGFVRNEIVSEVGGIMQGEVVEWLDSDKLLYLAHVGGEADCGPAVFSRFSIGSQLRGDNSIATIVTLGELQEIQPGAPGGASGHVDDWDLSSLEFLDFSESNPLVGG